MGVEPTLRSCSPESRLGDFSAPDLAIITQLPCGQTLALPSWQSFRNYRAGRLIALPNARSFLISKGALLLRHFPALDVTRAGIEPTLLDRKSSVLSVELTGHWDLFDNLFIRQGYFVLYSQIPKHPGAESNNTHPATFAISSYQ